MTNITNAFRIKKEVDLYTDFLNVCVEHTYEKFIKSDFISILHEMIILEANQGLTYGEVPNDFKSAGILELDPWETYHQMKNKFIKASMKTVAGDPFDQNITVLVKWDAEYYYLIFLNNGKLAESIYSELIEEFPFLEEYSYNDKEPDEERQDNWINLIGSEFKYVDFLQFELLSYKRINEWIMEPILGLPQAENWTYRFTK